MDGAVCNSDTDAASLKYYSYDYVNRTRKKCLSFWWRDETKDYEIGW